MFCVSIKCLLNSVPVDVLSQYYVYCGRMNIDYSQYVFSQGTLAVNECCIRTILLNVVLY